MISRTNLAILALGIALGATVNGWRLGEQIAELEAKQERERVDFQVRARMQEYTWNIKVQEVIDAAKKREETLRADADRARSSAVRLRDQLADYQRRLPELTEQAVRRYADATSVVLAECTAEYTALAEQADRIDSDRQKLEDAWPK